MSTLSTPSQQIDRDNGISGLVVAPIGYLVILFLPVFLEVASSDLGLSNAEVGLLGATDSAGLALATLFCAIAIKRLNFHRVAIAGMAIAVTGNLLSIPIDDFVLLCMVRVVTGFGEGLLVAVGITAVGMTHNTERWFGLYTAVIVVVQVLGLLVVAPVHSQWQLPGVFILMAGLYLLPLTVLGRLPANSEAYIPAGTANSKSSRPTSQLWLALLATIFFYMCIGGVWAYISMMGTQVGLTLQYVSLALAAAMGAGFLGALFFAAIGDHAKRHSLLAIAVVVMAFCLWLLNGFSSGVAYMLITCVYSFFWSIVGARLFAVISDADHSGRYISAAQTMLAVGFFIGPLSASALVGEHGFWGVNTMGIAALILCFVAVTPLALWERQRSNMGEKEAVGEV